MEDKNFQSLEAVFDAFNESPIAYHRVYARLTGSVTAGLLLSQVIYWAKVMHWRKYYKIDREWVEETGMSQKELRAAKKRLVGLVDMSVEGMPAKTYYFVKKELIIAKIASLPKRDKLECLKGTNLFAQKGQTYNTEITQRLPDTYSNYKKRRKTGDNSRESMTSLGDVIRSSSTINALPI